MGKKVFVDLTHPFSADIPRWPYFDKPVIDSKHGLAKGGVLTQYVGCTMHTGTHCDAPRHVMEKELVIHIKWQLMHIQVMQYV